MARMEFLTIRKVSYRQTRSYRLWRLSDEFRTASHDEPKRLARGRSTSFYDCERWNQTFVGLRRALLLCHKLLFSRVILPKAQHAPFERMNTLDQFIGWGEAAIIGEPQIDTRCTPWRCTISETSPHRGQRDRSRNGRPAEEPRLPTRNGGGAWLRSGARWLGRSLRRRRPPNGCVGSAC